MEDEKKFNNKVQNTSFAAYNLNLETFFRNKSHNKGWQMGYPHPRGVLPSKKSFRFYVANCDGGSARKGCCRPPTLRVQNGSIAAYNLKLKTFFLESNTPLVWWHPPLQTFTMEHFSGSKSSFQFKVVSCNRDALRSQSGWKATPPPATASIAVCNLKSKTFFGRQYPLGWWYPICQSLLWNLFCLPKKFSILSCKLQSRCLFFIMEIFFVFQNSFEF